MKYFRMRSKLEDRMLKRRSYRDYGSTSYEVWPKSFINHTSLLVSLFGATAPRLRAALAQLYVAVLQIFKGL